MDLTFVLSMQKLFFYPALLCCIVKLHLESSGIIVKQSLEFAKLEGTSNLEFEVAAFRMVY